MTQLHQSWFLFVFVLFCFVLTSQEPLWSLIQQIYIHGMPTDALWGLGYGDRNWRGRLLIHQGSLPLCFGSYCLTWNTNVPPISRPHLPAFSMPSSPLPSTPSLKRYKPDHITQTQNPQWLPDTYTARPQFLSRRHKSLAQMLLLSFLPPL